MLGNPDQQNDAQPKQIRVLHVPDYFAEYREKWDRFAAFLGASLVAKVSLSLLSIQYGSMGMNTHFLP